jgi:hypothetical protein
MISFSSSGTQAGRPVGTWAVTDEFYGYQSSSYEEQRTWSEVQHGRTIWDSPTNPALEVVSVKMRTFLFGS